MGCGAALLLLSLIDADHMLLPDEVTQPLLWAGLSLNWLSVLPLGLRASFEGAVMGYLALNVLGWLWFKLSEVEGLGQGDIKLVAALGAWLGVQGLLFLLVTACLSGCMFVLAQRCFTHFVSPMLREPGRVDDQQERHFPFGPHLAIGAVVALGLSHWELGAFRSLMR